MHMAKVMMRCPADWYKEFFSGIEVPRKQGLKGLGNTVVACPICKKHHYLRRLYFEGDEKPGNEASRKIIDVSALDVAYGFAGEIGVIIGEMALIEGYFPKLLIKLIPMSEADAFIIMGAPFNFSNRVDLIELIAKSRGAHSEIKEDIVLLGKKMRAANNIRVKYAHARYSVAHEKIHIVPFFDDPKKSQQTIITTTDDVMSDLELIKEIKDQLHGYIYRNERPKR